MTFDPSKDDPPVLVFFFKVLRAKCLFDRDGKSLILKTMGVIGMIMIRRMIPFYRIVFMTNLIPMFPIGEETIQEEEGENHKGKVVHAIIMVEVAA